MGGQRKIAPSDYFMGKRWVIETFDQYVTNEVDVVEYVLGVLINVT